MIVEGKIGEIVRYNHSLAMLQIQTTAIGAPLMLCLPVNVTDLTPYKHKTNRFRNLRNIKCSITPPLPPPLPNPAIQTRRTTPSLPFHDMEELAEASGRDNPDEGYDTASAVVCDSDDVAHMAK